MQSTPVFQPAASLCLLALWLVQAAVVGCAPATRHQGATAADAEPGERPQTQTSGSSPSGASAPTAAAGGGPTPTPASGETSAQQLMPDTPADPSRSLPEVTVRNVGLHIGGQPNDAASKAPFQAAIEARFDDFLRCYRHLPDPGGGGVFGVDLFIKRTGGHPEVRQPRTGMQGVDFRRCVVEAFESVEFERPRHGPTVISYSIRFEVSDPQGGSE